MAEERAAGRGWAARAFLVAFLGDALDVGLHALVVAGLMHQHFAFGPPVAHAVVHAAEAVGAGVAVLATAAATIGEVVAARAAMRARHEEERRRVDAAAAAAVAALDEAAGLNRHQQQQQERAQGEDAADGFDAPGPLSGQALPGDDWPPVGEGGSSSGKVGGSSNGNGNGNGDGDGGGGGGVDAAVARQEQQSEPRRDEL